MLDKTDPEFPISNKGLISLNGVTIHPFETSILRFERRSDNLILVIHGHFEEVETDDAEIEEIEIIDRVNLINSIGQHIEDDIKNIAQYDYYLV